MADPEQIRMLKQGVKTWNEWLENNHKIRPDLRKADLSFADLTGANLSRAILSGAKLKAAELSGAKLKAADLSRANLRKAKINGAFLEEANLSGADLYDANLQKAYLIGANLSGADLNDADLSWADLHWADLVGANLSGATLREAALLGADLSRANLHEAFLNEANLQEANLRKADLSRATLVRADLSDADFLGANLSGADLSWATLIRTDLSGAILRRANLSHTNFTNSNLIKATLTEANLVGAFFVETNLDGADISNSKIYSISTWNLRTNKDTKQLGLVITKADEPIVTVDDIEVAQFIYFLLKNQKIRNVINTVANKAVLILGRFTKNRKEVLDAIAEKLRTMDLVPIIFDFEKSEEQDIIETVITLASLSKFIIADVTAARVIADELRSFVPDFAVPVVPVFQPSKEEPIPYASLKTLYRKYTWVFEPVVYKNKEHLIEILPDKVIKPAEVKRLELRDIKKSG